MFIKNKKNLNIDLYEHMLKAMKNKKTLTLVMIITTILISLLVVWNIKAVEYITALLVSKSVLDSIPQPNSQDIYEILNYLGINATQEQIDQILDKILLGSNIYEQIIQKFFYNFVYYDGTTLYIQLLNKNLNLFDFVYTMIGDILIVVLLSYFNFILSGNIAQAYEAKLKENLINKLIDQDLDYFNKNKTGEIISTVTKDNLKLSSYIKEAPIIYCLSFFTTIFSLIIMFTISWELALCVFGLLIAFILMILAIMLISSNSTKKINNISKNLDNELSEKIYTIRLIKSTGTFNSEKENFKNSIKTVERKNKKKFFLSEIPSALIVAGIGSFSMAAVIFGVFLFYNETQSLISIMTSFTAGVIVMTMPILQLRQIIIETPSSKIAAKNINNILKSEIAIQKYNTISINEEIKSISLNNISFAYPNSKENLFQNFNVKFEKGKKYAFVGPTGSGKSTIAKLLLRFYDYNQGNIIINEKNDLKELNLKSWLDKIGYVDQEPQILSGNIYDNVAYGLENKTKSQIIEACKKAKLHNLIMSWPEGYETILFERGSQLSGGQKQRLVIARLILKNPEILILDEATSALDNIVEAEIQKELEKLMKNKTTISIAHRLATIKGFDKIFVLEQNLGIVQSGTFEELIKMDGLFKNLYQLSK